MRQDIALRGADIERWIQEQRTKAYICQQLKCRPATLDGWLRRMGLMYTGQQRRFGHISPNRRPAGDYLRADCFISSHRLKTLLLRDGLKQACCEVCGGTQWMGQSIPLELHHADGDRLNNRLENLTLLCPNCHALTPNNSGKAIKRR